jgi:hypothetical protein
MISNLAVGASLLLKITVDGDSGKESTLGFVSRLSYNVSNGQKLIFTVDSPFPEEIAQGASQSFVRGTMSVYMLNGQSLETMGISHYRNNGQGEALGPLSKYFNLRIYNRQTNELVLSLDFCKISGYSVDMAARSIVTANISFEGMFASRGVGVS